LATSEAAEAAASARGTTPGARIWTWPGWLKRVKNPFFMSALPAAAMGLSLVLTIVYTNLSERQPAFEGVRNLFQELPMSLKAFCAAAALAVGLPLSALAGVPVEVEIRDRASGEILPVYRHDGEHYVVGEPGREYEIRLMNRGYGRVLAVTSVDGVNVITGKTASPSQSGYVLDPWGSIEIDGWRKSMDEVAAFYFTALPDSYAARTGRPDNVGVIGVALFRERVYAMLLESGFVAGAAPSAPAAAQSAERKASGALSDRAEDDRLGTGHGRRLDSAVVYTDFERASEEPAEVIRVFYDSRRNLVARGIIPQPWYRMARRQPDPFPHGFVPDP
jgi:hypothetical protein